MRALLLALALAGCTTPAVQTTTRCPPLESYTPAFQAAVADEWDGLSWRVRKLLNDYRALRVQCRAVQ